VEVLKNLNWVGRHPDLNLLESFFYSPFELHEELAIFWCIGNVSKNSYQLVLVSLPLVLPTTPDGLRFHGNGAKLPFQFEERLDGQFLGIGCPSLYRSGRSTSNRR
jgi:hypothetical protein